MVDQCQRALMAGASQSETAGLPLVAPNSGAMRCCALNSSWSDGAWLCGHLSLIVSYSNLSTSISSSSTALPASILASTCANFSC